MTKSVATIDACALRLGATKSSVCSVCNDEVGHGRGKLLQTLKQASDQQDRARYQELEQLDL